jgi:hypothetical protein
MNEYDECLAPCKCGGKVKLTGGTYGYPTFWIECLKCGGRWCMDTYSAEEAAEKWGIKEDIEITDWLTRGISEEQLQKEKKKALKQIARMKKREKIAEWLKQHLKTNF